MNEPPASTRGIRRSAALRVGGGLVLLLLLGSATLAEAHRAGAAGPPAPSTADRPASRRADPPADPTAAPEAAPTGLASAALPPPAVPIVASGTPATRMPSAVTWVVLLAAVGGILVRRAPRALALSLALVLAIFAGESALHSAHPVEGIEKTLKVEVKAGPQSRVFELYPRFRTPGRYDAVFFPTVATTYAFRLVGTVGNVAVDVTFTCNPAGHVATAEDRAVVKVTDTVTRKGLVGSFGCPQPWAEAEFPPARRP